MPSPTPIPPPIARMPFLDFLKFSLLLFSLSVMSDSLWPHGLQHPRLPCPSLSPRAFSNSCPLSWWCHPTILSSVVPFSSCLQSFPASESFPVNWFFISGGQSIEASVLPMNLQGWFPRGLTGLNSLLSKGLSRVFSNTTVRKHQFFRAQSLWSSFHIYTWLLEETRVQSLGWEDPLQKEMAIHSSILPGKSHGQRSLEGYSPWGHKESDTTERLHFD